MIAFTYVVLKYVHDSAAGESLNVGVLLVAPELGFVDFRIDPSVARLSSAFRNFNATLYRSVMRNLQLQVDAWNRPLVEGQMSLLDLRDAGAHIRWIWPDRGLNYQATEARAGEAEDPRQALDSLFDRFVVRQAPDRQPRVRRDDLAVWKEVNTRLPADISTRLIPARVDAGPFQFRFDHTYRNGKLHIVEALSFDLLESDSVRDKSLRWMGYAQHLQPYLGSLRLVVEGPDKPEVLGAYRSAVSILSAATKIYEADQTDRLTHDLELLMA